ncbi:MAG: hypothetical protein DMF51_01320 [Acidobacteria bacterium]|nr:MAG: hypothetical protein DMF51_01320 [Acidobacteriota bacterium]
MTRTMSLAVVLALSLGGAAADSPPSSRVEIEQFVRTYVEANNATDPDAVMDLMSRRPDVSSVTMGAVARGPDAIRRETGTLAGIQGSHRMGLNSDLHGALTLVIEKSSGKWKVLHEHVSLQFPLTDVQGESRD